MLFIVIHEAIVEHARVVVIEGDVYMENDHWLVELDEGLGLKVFDALFRRKKHTLVAINLLDDLQVDLELD